MSQFAAEIKLAAFAIHAQGASVGASQQAALLLHASHLTHPCPQGSAEASKHFLAGNNDRWKISLE